MFNSYYNINFDIVQAATNNRYADGDKIRLVNLGRLALFSNYKMTTSSGKHWEGISHSHINSSIYKLLTSARGCDGSSIGFDRDRGRRQPDLNNNRNINGKYHVRFMPKDIFGFAEHQREATFGLGYKLTLTRKTDNAVLIQDNPTNFGPIKIKSI